MFMTAGKALMASGGAPLRVSDVFSVTADTATNLDSVSTTGWDGLIAKSRANATDWVWRNSAAGLTTYMSSNSTAVQASFSDYATLLGSGNSVLYRFKKAAKFFDVVAGTCDASGNFSASHSLGVTPGLIIVKRRTVNPEDWHVYHRSLSSPNDNYLQLDTTAGATSSAGTWTASSSSFSLNNQEVNGASMVAYLFAHDSSATGVIQCGSYTGNGSSTGPSVTLGWKPQFLLIKQSSASGNDWLVLDSTRGLATGADKVLLVDASGSEIGGVDFADTSSTGFQIKTSDASVNANSATYIYAAIRDPSS